MKSKEELRDYIALEVLKSVIGNIDAVKSINEGKADRNPIKNLSEWAYLMADAMIVERENEK